MTLLTHLALGAAGPVEQREDGNPAHKEDGTCIADSSRAPQADGVGVGDVQKLIRVEVLEGISHIAVGVLARI